MITRTGAKSGLPPLAQYCDISTYKPSYGDFVVWSGWVTTWHGVVSYYDQVTDELHVIFSNIPYLLFTLEDAEQERDTKRLKLSDVRRSNHGVFAIMQHDYTQNANVWYL